MTHDQTVADIAQKLRESAQHVGISALQPWSAIGTLRQCRWIELVHHFLERSGYTIEDQDTLDREAPR